MFYIINRINSEQNFLDVCALQYTFAKSCSVAYSWVEKAVQKLVTDVHLDVESPYSDIFISHV